MRLSGWLLAISLAAGLSACGGGGGSDGASAGGGNTSAGAGASGGASGGADTGNGGNAGNGGSNGVTPTPAPTSADRIAVAAASGDSSGLLASDSATLLDMAIASATSARDAQASILANIYGNSSVVPSLAFNLGTNSSDITPRASTTAMTLVSADDGSSLAAISNVGNGRALAYGADVLVWMAGTTKEQQHYPFFRRAWGWLLTGNANSTLPANVRYATAGYTAANVKTLIERTGSTATAITCDLTSPSNTCWNNADVLVFGGSVASNAALQSTVTQYLNAGKAVVYMQPGWGDSAGGRQVLAAMGMTLGGYPGNYFAGTSAVSVGSGRTIAASLTALDTLSPLVNTLNQLKQTSVNVDLTTDTSSPSAITRTMNELQTLQSASVDIFAADPHYALQRLLVLWADLWRPNIVYGKVPRSDAANFLRAYASDSWVDYNRVSTRVSPTGQGDFMPASAQSMAVASDWEDIDVTIAQTSGNTLIGRAAVPGKPLQIQVVDAAGASSLGIQTSYIRTWGNPLTDSDATYLRPRRPNSFNLPLGTAPVNFVTPFGGPLVLSYSGATANSVVKLRVKGGAKYAHFDFTRSMSAADTADALAALKAGTFGWQTTKLIGGEIEQTTKLAQAVIGNTDPAVYVNQRIRDGLFMSNHIANGYNDAGMTTEVANLCATLGWTCDGPIHNAPVVQHFVGWLAACGYLCSGNPIDGYAGIDIGWGYAHEMGHNTVQRVMHIVPDGTHGCVVECDNNILSSTTALRVYKTLGIEISGGHPLDNPGLYSLIVANRNTGLSGDAQIADMETRVWSNPSQDVMRPVHFQLAYLFTRYRSGLAQPTMETTLDFFSLLTKGDRLVAKNFSTSNAASYGMGRYANNTIGNSDLLYVLSSKIIGKDVRKLFAMYGIPLSADALGSIADLGLAVAPMQFYALPALKHNQLQTGVWMDIDSSTPPYPL
ncbi:ImpA family metalloprotease [Amantichitinum ursilacus]|uniref:Peptidase M60 domain-containing protein n=1 Tax=Amantichitinum ursilacus TaxID=857265 RepID=A0A0N0GKZ0_9NEIS|nr:ImpA family metalloprotease [Amantichitinum ursilacus]KPC49554.1 hypothetical protein WG78_19560 [Amantichitinum ursilacus]